MSALTASRNTPEWNATTRKHFGLIPVAASSSLYVGGMVALDTSRRAVAAQARSTSNLAKLSVIGICGYVYAGGILPPGVNALNQTGNDSLYPGATATLGTAGAISVGVVQGIFGMDTDTTIQDATHVGDVVFAKDDHTVTRGTAVANTTSLVMPSSAPFITVLKPDIAMGSFTATANSGGTGTVYVEGTDYAIDYQNGLFTALAGGALANGNATIYCSYYSAATLVAAGRMMAYENGLAWVDFSDKSVSM